MKTKTTTTGNLPNELDITQLVLLEIVISGATVLKDSFGFTDEQIDEWLQGTLMVANARRTQIEIGVLSALQ